MFSPQSGWRFFRGKGIKAYDIAFKVLWATEKYYGIRTENIQVIDKPELDFMQSTNLDHIWDSANIT